MTSPFLRGFAAAAVLVFTLSSAVAAEKGSGPVALTQLKVWQGGISISGSFSFKKDKNKSSATPTGMNLKMGPEVPVNPPFRVGGPAYTATVPYRTDRVTVMVSVGGGASPEASGVTPGGAPLKIASRIKGLAATVGGKRLRGDIFWTFSGLLQGRNTIGIEAKRLAGRKEPVAALTVVRRAPDLAHPGDRERYFFRSLISGNAKGVADALKAGADVDKYYDGGKGRRAPGLIFAVANNKMEILRLLLAHKAKVDAVLKDKRGRIDDGMSPLMGAVNKGNRKMVALLIAAGADVNHTLPPPKFGRRGKNMALVGASVLIAALVRKREEIVRMLIAAGANVNRPLPDSVFGGNASVSGVSPLIFAVNMGLEKTVATLIEAGADVNYRIPGERRKLGKNPKTAGLTALIVAKAKKRTKFVRMLLDAGAK